MGKIGASRGESSRRQSRKEFLGDLAVAIVLIVMAIGGYLLTTVGPVACTVIGMIVAIVGGVVLIFHLVGWALESVS